MIDFLKTFIFIFAPYSFHRMSAIHWRCTVPFARRLICYLSDLYPWVSRLFPALIGTSMSILWHTPIGQHSSALSGSCTLPGSLAILVVCLWITPAMDGVLALLLLSFCALTAVFLRDFGGSSREQWCACVMLFKLMYLKSIIWDKSFQVYWPESLCLISALDKHFCLIVQENL